MKYAYAVSRAQAFTPQQASVVLPQHFSFREEDGQLLLVIDLPDNFTDEQAFGQVQRECDRLFFLTGEQLDPKIHRKEKPDGSTTGFSYLAMDALLIKPLTPEVDSQQWQWPPLIVQLRLWQLAQLPALPIASRLNLLFQIIEISYPNTNDHENEYPLYQNSNTLPHPRTEAKLLRDLASHGNKQMGNQQVQLYCRHLGISEHSHDPTDADFIRVLHSRLSFMESEARKVIESSITRKP